MSSIFLFIFNMLHCDTIYLEAFTPISKITNTAYRFIQ